MGRARTTGTFFFGPGFQAGLGLFSYPNSTLALYVGLVCLIECRLSWTLYLSLLFSFAKCRIPSTLRPTILSHLPLFLARSLSLSLPLSFYLVLARPPLLFEVAETWRLKGKG